MQTVRNLTSQEPLGELIPVEFSCEVDPNDPSVNGHDAYTVNNVGGVTPMGTSVSVVNPLIGEINVDPKDVVYVKERLIFTDNGGIHGNHTPGSSQPSSSCQPTPASRFG